MKTYKNKITGSVIEISKDEVALNGVAIEGCPEYVLGYEYQLCGNGPDPECRECWEYNFNRSKNWELAEHE